MRTKFKETRGLHSGRRSRHPLVWIKMLGKPFFIRSHLHLGCTRTLKSYHGKDENFSFGFFLNTTNFSPIDWLTTPESPNLTLTFWDLDLKRPCSSRQNQPRAKCRMGSQVEPARRLLVPWNTPPITFGVSLKHNSGCVTLWPCHLHQ